MQITVYSILQGAFPPKRNYRRAASLLHDGRLFMRGAVSLLQDSRLFTRGAVLNWFRRRSRCQVVAYDCTVDVGRSYGGDRRRHAAMSFNMTML